MKSRISLSGRNRIPQEPDAARVEAGRLCGIRRRGDAPRSGGGDAEVEGGSDRRFRLQILQGLHAGEVSPRGPEAQRGGPVHERHRRQTPPEGGLERARTVGSQAAGRQERMSMRIWIAIGVLLPCSTSGLLGMVPPEYMEAARQRAAMHFQVEVVGVTEPTRTPGACIVRSTVRRVFDDSIGLLESGQTVSLSISCRGRADTVPPSGTLWTQVHDLKAAKFLEVYLDLSADSRYPQVPTVNYALSQAAIEKPTVDGELRDAHFVVAIESVTREPGGQ